MKNIKLLIGLSVASILGGAGIWHIAPELTRNFTQSSDTLRQSTAYFHDDEMSSWSSSRFALIPFQTSSSVFDSTAIITEAYNAAIETMMDEKGTISHGLDTAISPCENHFLFVNGGWRNSVTMPKSTDRDQQMMTPFTYAHLKMMKGMEKLLDSSRKVYSSTSNHTIRVLGTFYESCMAADTLEYVILKKARLAKNKTDSTRTQECLSRTLEYLGSAAGQALAEDLKKSGAFERMNVLTSALKEAVIEQIRKNTIMNPEEKKNALDRLSLLMFRVGIPDSFVDYSEVKLSPTDYWENKATIAGFRHGRWSDRIGGGVRERWKMSLLRANASYLLVDHAIEIPTLMFYPPFYYREGEDLLNFAAIGYVVGHEIFHSVSPHLYSVKDPRMNKEIADYKDFISSLPEFEGWRNYGEATFSEDVADLGGLRVAYAAWKQTIKKDKKYKDKVVEGYTPDQRFFIAFGRVWRSKWTPAGVRYGVHGAGFARINAGAMQNPEFRKAFGCKPGDKMYLGDDKLSKIW